MSRIPTTQFDWEYIVEPYGMHWQTDHTRLEGDRQALNDILFKAADPIYKERDYRWLSFTTIHGVRRRRVESDHAHIANAQAWDQDGPRHHRH